jgi:hypothetical protein
LFLFLEFYFYNYMKNALFSPIWYFFTFYVMLNFIFSLNLYISCSRPWISICLLFIVNILFMLVWWFCFLRIFILFALIFLLWILFLQQYEKGFFRPNF